jgi:hypothetical protein
LLISFDKNQEGKYLATSCRMFWTFVLQSLRGFFCCSETENACRKGLCITCLVGNELTVSQWTTKCTQFTPAHHQTKSTRLGKNRYKQKKSEKYSIITYARHKLLQAVAIDGDGGASKVGRLLSGRKGFPSKLSTHTHHAGSSRFGQNICKGHMMHFTFMAQALKVNREKNCLTGVIYILSMQRMQAARQIHGTGIWETLLTLLSAWLVCLTSVLLLQAAITISAKVMCDRAALHCPGRELLPLKLSLSRRVSQA